MYNNIPHTMFAKRTDAKREMMSKKTDYRTATVILSETTIFKKLCSMVEPNTIRCSSEISNNNSCAYGP